MNNEQTLYRHLTISSYEINFRVYNFRNKFSMDHEKLFFAHIAKLRCRMSAGLCAYISNCPLLTEGQQVNW